MNLPKLLQLIILLSTFQLFSNIDVPVRKGSIVGEVMDLQTQLPLPYVSIVVKSTEGTVVDGTVTDEAGKFEVEKIEEGDYILEVSYIGYVNLSKKISITSSALKVNVGTLYMEEDTAALEEVEVIAERSTVEQKIDRKIINVGKDLTSVGATASELLNNVQSVSVDSQSGNISLRGNENVRVLVDGKPSNIPSAQLLKQLPSTSIKSVELITNPSAKYNPEGMSGIINIVLHKNANLGFNGSLNTGVTQGLNTRYNSSLNMNFRTGKVNFFGNYGYNDGKSNNYGFVERDDQSLYQDFNTDDYPNSHILKVGADIYINDKNTISFFTTLNKASNLTYSSTIITGDFESNSPVETDRENETRTYDVNYTYDFDKEGEKIEFEANISDYDKSEYAQFQELVKPYDYTQNYNDQINDDKNTDLYNIDYTNPLFETAKLELGLEARFNDTKNSRETTQHNFVYDSEGNLIPENVEYEGTIYPWYETSEVGNSSFTYDRAIYSTYVNYQQQFEKLTMQIGARLEQYEVDGSFQTVSESALYEDDIFTVYPSAFFTYKASEVNQYQVSYSRRVDRPSIQQVNPIREWSTPLITSIGNPELRPQFTNSFEFNYTRQYAKGMVSFGAFYRVVKDNITRVLNVDEFDEEKLELTYMNGDTNNRYGFELSSSHAFAPWWRANSSIDLYAQTQSGIANGEEIEVENNIFNARIMNSFTATKKLRFQLFGMYRGGGRSLQFDVDPMWMVNAGASLTVFNGQGTLTFNVNDIFQGMKFKFDSEIPIPQHGQFNWESRTAYLGFMYNFGSGKNRARARKRRDNNESSGSGGFL